MVTTSKKQKIWIELYVYALQLYRGGLKSWQVADEIKRTKPVSLRAFGFYNEGECDDFLGGILDDARSELGYDPDYKEVANGP